MDSITLEDALELLRYPITLVCMSFSEMSFVSFLLITELIHFNFLGKPSKGWPTGDLKAYKTWIEN